jgi:ferredoxin
LSANQQLLKFGVEVFDHYCEHRKGGEEVCDPVELSSRLRGRKALIIRGIYDQQHLKLYRDAVLRAGLNPLLVQVIDYRWNPWVLEATRAALEAAWAADRARFTEESVEYTRREIMTGNVHPYSGRSSHPVYIREACGDLYRVCDICQRSCPYGAIEIDRAEKRAVIVDDAKCTDCGLCAAACPMGAIQMPNYPDASFANVGIVKGDKVVSCRLHEGESLKLPCVGELSPVDLLAMRAGGSVTVHCPDPGCKLAGNLSALKELLGELDEVYGGFAFSQGGGPSRPQARDGAPAVRAAAPSYRRPVIIAALADEASAPLLGVRDLSVDDTCTLCENCAKWCPTNALTIAREGDRTLLRFDPSSCVGCDVCVNVCPEFRDQGGSRVRAISARPHSGALERRTLAEDHNVYCRDCGAFVGTRRTLDKVKRTMEERGLPVDDEWLERCPKHRFEYSIRKGIQGSTAFGPKR